LSYARLSQLKTRVFSPAMKVNEADRS